MSHYFQNSALSQGYGALLLGLALAGMQIVPFFMTRSWRISTKHRNLVEHAEVLDDRKSLITGFCCGYSRARVASHLRKETGLLDKTLSFFKKIHPLDHYESREAGKQIIDEEALDALALIHYLSTPYIIVPEKAFSKNARWRMDQYSHCNDVLDAFTPPGKPKVSLIYKNVRVLNLGDLVNNLKAFEKIGNSLNTPMGVTMSSVSHSLGCLYDNDKKTWALAEINVGDEYAHEHFSSLSAEALANHIHEILFSISPNGLGYLAKIIDHLITLVDRIVSRKPWCMSIITEIYATDPDKASMTKALSNWKIEQDVSRTMDDKCGYSFGRSAIFAFSLSVKLNDAAMFSYAMSIYRANQYKPVFIAGALLCNSADVLKMMLDDESTSLLDFKLPKIFSNGEERTLDEFLDQVDENIAKIVRDHPKYKMLNTEKSRNRLNCG